MPHAPIGALLYVPLDKRYKLLLFVNTELLVQPFGVGSNGIGRYEELLAYHRQRVALDNQQGYF